MRSRSMRYLSQATAVAFSIFAITSAQGANSAPVANAGPYQTVAPAATVYLDGSGSTDVDGNSLTFTWTMTDKPFGSHAILKSPNTVSPFFTVDINGVYTFSLVVSDGLLT